MTKLWKTAMGLLGRTRSNLNEVQKLYLRTLEIGIQNIRVQGYKQNGPQCNIEAYHIHNMPDMILGCTDGKVEESYLTQARKNYLREAEPAMAENFNEVWKRLEKCSIRKDLRESRLRGR